MFMIWYFLFPCPLCIHAYLFLWIPRASCCGFFLVPLLVCCFLFVFILYCFIPPLSLRLSCSFSHFLCFGFMAIHISRVSLVPRLCFVCVGVSYFPVLVQFWLYLPFVFIILPFLVLLLLVNSLCVFFLFVSLYVFICFVFFLFCFLVFLTFVFILSCHCLPLVFLFLFLSISWSWCLLFYFFSSYLLHFQYFPFAFK